MFEREASLMHYIIRVHKLNVHFLVERQCVHSNRVCMDGSLTVYSLKHPTKASGQMSRSSSLRICATMHGHAVSPKAVSPHQRRIQRSRRIYCYRTGLRIGARRRPARTAPTRNRSWHSCAGSFLNSLSVRWIQSHHQS